MKKISILVLFSIVFVFLPFLSSGSQTKGIEVVVKDTSGRKVGLYKGSHALVIGVGDYTAGWPKLESIPYEIEQVEAALKKQGFHVVKVVPIHKWPICPISASGSNDNPRNTAMYSCGYHFRLP